MNQAKPARSAPINVHQWSARCFPPLGLSPKHKDGVLDAGPLRAVFRHEVMGLCFLPF